MSARRSHHLPPEAYAVEGSTWHVTITVRDGLDKPFADPIAGARVLKSFDRGIRTRGDIPHLICVMPDHLHALIEIRSLNLLDLVARLKSESTQIWWGCGGRGTLWLKDFYDRGIREPEDFEEIARYILMNPIRAGLAEELGSYPLICGDLLQDR